jgi:penicillin-binding protein 2
VLDNGRTRYPFGRCWVASKWSDVLGINNVAHHPVPTSAPHRGHDGNKDGWLTYSDALERSCNVYFETIADRLKIDALSAWMERFGLGHPTGIGIQEFRGRVPSQAKPIIGTRRSVGFFAGIGQGSVWATPIQMANIAATIARDGIWMRPHLLLHQPGVPFPANNLPPGPERVDLHLAPEALRACKLGMVNVVNSVAGTGTGVARNDMVVAAKTGTAQAAEFKTLVVDRRGKAVRDAAGKRQFVYYQLSTPNHPNSKMPWYRGSGRDWKDFNHSWMIGFAPAENPQVAFAVLVEYGGSGGGPAADVANEALDACIAHRHLFPPRQPGRQEEQADAR